MLLLSLHVHNILPKAFASILKPLGSAFASIGVYSYSIYLWQGAVSAYLLGLAFKIFHIAPGKYLGFAVVLVETLLVGIIMSRLVEYPVIRLRNRLFPSPTSTSSYIAESAGPPQSKVPAPSD